MARFPTVAALAAASVADVLRAWAGLGYNRRAVNLHRAARAIVAEHDGRVPDTVEGLMSLPGVGPYTARAVSAIAFGRPVGAVDTNVRRVLGRIAAGGQEALSAPGMQALANATVPPDRPGDWTHALMDVGQLLCRPRAPRCSGCPALAWCRFAAGIRPEVVAANLSPPPAARVSLDQPLATGPRPRPCARRPRRRVDRLRQADGLARHPRRPRGGHGAGFGGPARGARPIRPDRGTSPRVRMPFPASD